MERPELQPQPKKHPLGLRPIVDSLLGQNPPASHRPAALIAPNAGPRKVQTSGVGRAKRRARKAGRVKRVEKLNKGKADLQRKREQLLDTAAAFARIWFAGPPATQKKVGVSAFQRVAERVQKQADNLVATGKASNHADALEQIEDSMRETIRQHDVLLAQKITNQLAADKQAQIDALR